jgi:hypothetical protein
MRALFDFCVGTFGGVHLLINNASGPFRPGEEVESGPLTVQTELVGTRADALV